MFTIPLSYLKRNPLIGRKLKDKAAGMGTVSVSAAVRTGDSQVR